MNKAQKQQAEKLIRLAIAEDVPGGDVTSRYLGVGRKKARAKIIAKESLCLCGVDLVRLVYRHIDPGVRIKILNRDGDLLEKGRCFAEITGKWESVVKGERISVNFLQHLSGVATLTRKFIKKAGTGKIKIMDTRKTLPGFRLLEKYAVKTGGGTNHRMSLSDAVLIKENHVRHFDGDVARAVEKALKSRGKKKITVEVEVRNKAEFLAAHTMNPDVIMLDNMTPGYIRTHILPNNKKRIVLEVSGGVTLKNVAAYSKLPVDRISIGALTHSVPAVDISMLIQ